MCVRDRGFGFLKNPPDGNPLGGADDVTSPEKTTPARGEKRKKEEGPRDKGYPRWDTPLHEARTEYTTTIVQHAT